MKIDIVSLIFGIIFGIIICYLFLRRVVSKFTEEENIIPVFSSDLTLEQGSELYDQYLKNFTEKLDKEYIESKSSGDLEKEYDTLARSRKILTDLADSYNKWLAQKQKENPSMPIFRPKNAEPLPSMIA